MATKKKQKNFISSNTEVNLSFQMNSCETKVCEVQFPSKFLKEEFFCNHLFLAKVWCIICFSTYLVIPEQPNFENARQLSQNSFFCGIPYFVPSTLNYLFVHVWSCFQCFPVEKKITACWSYSTLVNTRLLGTLFL